MYNLIFNDKIILNKKIVMSALIKSFKKPFLIYQKHLSSKAFGNKINIDVFSQNDNLKEFETNAYKALNIISDHLSSPRDRVIPDCKPNFLKAIIPKKPNKKGEAFDDILKEFESSILPYMTRIDSSGYVGWFPTQTAYHATSIQLISNYFLNPSTSYESNRPTFELEKIVTKWFRNAYGLPDNFKQPTSGAIVYHGVSLCAAASALAARRLKTKQFPYVSLDKFKYYCSTEAHYSLKKAANISGYISEFIPVKRCEDTVNFNMDVEYLEKKLEEDYKNGFIPVMITATIGTTGTTGIDDLIAVGRLAKKYNTWFHVDAAYSGNSLIMEDYKWILKGVENADSFCFNPVKMIPIQYSACCFFADVTKAVKAYEAEQVFSYKELDLIDLELSSSKTNKSLKMFTLIQSCGMGNLRDVGKRLYESAMIAEKRFREDTRFDIVFPTKFGLVNFKLKHKGNSELLRLSDHINRRGKLLIGPITIKIEGKEVSIMRLSINWLYANPKTTLDQVEEIIEAYEDLFTDECIYI